MTVQPIDLPSLLRAVLWPSIAVVALIIFRGPLSDLVSTLGQRIRKLSFGGFSLKLAEATEVKPSPALDTEIRQLEAGLYPQSGVTGLTSLLSQLQHGGQNDYIVIDLGSEASPRWLTSRLYLLAMLITLIDRSSLCLVFVETVSGVRKRFVGLASPDSVRWALARRYSWLEAAGAAAYAIASGLYYTAQGAPQVAPSFPFDPATGFLFDPQLSQLVQQFLTSIRVPQPTAGPPAQDPGEWVIMPGQQSEHAKWLDGPRIERLLGGELASSQVTLPPNKTVNDLTDAVLRQQGHFVAIVDLDKSFRGLVDRLAALDKLAGELLRNAAHHNSPAPA